MSGQPISPVNEIETRVTGKRIVQYIVDIILYGIVASLLSFALNRGHGGVAAVLLIILVLLHRLVLPVLGVYPFARNGQTIGMSLLGLRVISADGGPASLDRLFVRSILILLFGPIAWLVGIITMMCSRYRQRVGDHMAKTMVVNASVGADAGRQSSRAPGRPARPVATAAGDPGGHQPARPGQPVFCRPAATPLTVSSSSRSSRSCRPRVAAVSARATRPGRAAGGARARPRTDRAGHRPRQHPPASEQPVVPGDREHQRRVRSYSASTCAVRSGRSPRSRYRSAIRRSVFARLISALSSSAASSGQPR